MVDERGNVVGVVSAKLNAGAALRSSGVPQSGMNYAVKSSYLLKLTGICAGSGSQAEGGIGQGEEV